MSKMSKKKSKRIVRFFIKWIIPAFIVALIASSMTLGGYDWYREGKYFAKFVKCYTTSEITVNGETAVYSLIYDKDVNGSYWLEKGTCSEFEAWENSNTFKEMYGVKSGPVLWILIFMSILGCTLNLFLICGIVLVIIILIMEPLEMGWNVVVRWIERGKPRFEQNLEE